VTSSADAQHLFVILAQQASRLAQTQWVRQAGAASGLS